MQHNHPPMPFTFLLTCYVNNQPKTPSHPVRTRPLSTMMIQRCIYVMTSGNKHYSNNNDKNRMMRSKTYVQEGENGVSFDDILVIVLASFRTECHALTCIRLARQSKHTSAFASLIVAPLSVALFLLLDYVPFFFSFLPFFSCHLLFFFIIDIKHQLHDLCQHLIQPNNNNKRLV